MEKRIKSDFVSFPKIPRLSREIIVTEKIDGTLGQIYIPEDTIEYAMNENLYGVPFRVGSKNRWVFPESDNHGFAKWAYENVEELLKLGKGHHFGEWWGQGIQRGYGLKEKRFSLFRVDKWSDDKIRPKCCHVVPIITIASTFESSIIENALNILKMEGSRAAPKFMNPEGIIIFHTASGHLYKKTIKDDEKPKGGGRQ